MRKLFGLNFYNKSIKELVIDLDKEIESGNKVSIFTPNVDHIINNYEDRKARKLYEQGKYIVADGWPLVVSGKFKKIKIHRITGVDLMDKLLTTSNDERYSIYFLGGTNKTLEKLTVNIKKEYPNIEYIGCHNGFFNDDNKVIDDINKYKIKILFVGMGNPKQEIWIKENFDLINANLMIGVGGAINIFSGEVQRAPLWVQKIGMEWFYRFSKEPKRLFSRYFIKYPKFLKILLKEFWRNG